MAEASALDQRKQELLDGKRRWTIQDAGGDKDVFLSEFVVPLRELERAGFFDKSLEHKRNSRGGSHINMFDILGAINYNGKTEVSE